MKTVYHKRSNICKLIYERDSKKFCNVNIKFRKSNFLIMYV